MALGVKNMPEADTGSLFDRLAVSSLVGMVSVLGSIAAVFYLLPALWWTLAERGAVTTTLLIVAMIGVGGGLVAGGLRLLGPHPLHGLRGGIFLATAGLLALAVLTSWTGLICERFLWERSQVLAVGITTALGVGLLVVGVRFFFSPKAERWMVLLEDQGWWTIAPYKRTQGLRVRRGTILGIILLAGCGVYTLFAHKTLEFEPNEWVLAIPFTNRFIPLLSHVQFTLPLLLALASMWLAYRVVNLPTFADFLIATEAELNKVSWTTQKRLIQDTVVVLVTVLLLTVFLFLVDMAWGQLLKGIGVLQFEQKDTTEEQKQEKW